MHIETQQAMTRESQRGTRDIYMYIIYVWHFRSLRARLNAIFDNSLEMLAFDTIHYVTSSRYASSTDSSANLESIFP